VGKNSLYSCPSEGKERSEKMMCVVCRPGKTILHRTTREKKGERRNNIIITRGCIHAGERQNLGLVLKKRKKKKREKTKTKHTKIDND